MYLFWVSLVIYLEPGQLKTSLKLYKIEPNIICDSFYLSETGNKLDIIIFNVSFIHTIDPQLEVRLTGWSESTNFLAEFNCKN